MIELALVVGLAFIVYAATVLHSTGYVNANALFAYIQTIMALGTFPLLDGNRESHVQYGYITLAATLIYFVASFALMLRRPVMLRARGAWEPPPSPVRTFVPRLTTWLVLTLCVAIIAAYYVNVGASALIEGVRNTVSGGDADIAGIRLSAYAGERYFYPGYVNQFKNALFPALILVVVVYWWRSGRRRIFLTLALSSYAVFGLVGAGQRGAFVQSAVMVAVFSYLLSGYRFPRGSIRLGIIAVCVLVTVSMALGRGGSGLGSDASMFSHAVAALNDFVDRIVRQQQSAGLAAFEYIYAQPTQWGREWGQALTGLLPGVGGSDLGGRVFEQVYGSTRGTIPPSIWGSVYYNFGWLGVVLVPVLFAMTTSKVVNMSALSTPRNTLELTGIAGVATTLGFWASDSPIFIFNNGIAMYALLWCVGTAVRRRGDLKGGGRPVDPVSVDLG